MVFFKAYPEGETTFTPWVEISAEEAFDIQNHLEQKYGRDHTAQFYYTKDATKAAWDDDGTRELINKLLPEYEFVMFDFVPDYLNVDEPYLMIFHGKGF